MSRYQRVDRGAGSRSGQLLQHVDDPKRWLVRAFIGRNAKGKKQYRSEVVTGRKRDAEARLIELLQDKNRGKLTPRSAATLADLSREWLAHKGREVTPRTLRGYRDALDLYVLPSLGHRKVGDVTLREVDALYGAMREGKLPAPEPDEGGKPRGWKGGPLSARTVRLAHVALSQALSQAVKWGMIPFNSAAEATLPSGKPREKRALTVAERGRFLEAADELDAFHRVLYRVLMDTGLRPGEACALRWSDVDLAAGRLTVARAVTQGKDGERITDHPKTSKSRRTIPLFGLAPLLSAHLDWQRERGLESEGLVFTTQDGRMLAPWTINRRELERVLTKAKITGGLTLYSFRHTFATLHLQSGTPLKVVSEWLGHSTIQQTANTYQHLSAEVAEDWAARHVAFLESASREAAQLAVN